MLKNKVAVVTGGTRGIGYAVVEKYLDNGAKVIFCGSSEKTVLKAAEKIKEKYPDYVAEGLALDLSNPEEINSEFLKIKERHGSLDILVNNAGISQGESIYTKDPESFKKILELNVNSMFYCSQAAARIMQAQGGGVILNTSSMVSLYGQPAGVGYPTSKFAVNGMTKTLSRELAQDNIRVNAVAPGIINTDMVKALPDDVIQPLIDTIPLGRIGEPEDIANAFLFLASDLASYVTGEILSVDGAARS